MQMRLTLFLSGLFTTLVSLIALLKTAIPSSLMGAAISDKIDLLPGSPTLYLAATLAIGVLTVILAIAERKIVY